MPQQRTECSEMRALRPQFAAGVFCGAAFCDPQMIPWGKARTILPTKHISFASRLSPRSYLMCSLRSFDMREILICLSGALVLLRVCAGAAFAEPQSLGDPHLNVIPRTPQEAVQIANATALNARVPHATEALPGGDATVAVREDVNAFSQVSANTPAERELDFIVGNALFRRIWEAAPAEQAASDGLGPLYNALSCEACHIKDGRGHPPLNAQDDAISVLLRVSVPSNAKDVTEQIEGFIGTAPDPTYGAQIQDFAVPGQVAEAQLSLSYLEQRVAFADGTQVILRRPTFDLKELSYGPLHKEARLSPRIAPQMIGLGLLEAIPAADILALADPEDADKDGISGRPNVVWSKVHDQPMLGRFGLKAGVPTLLEQSASAFAADMGISSPLFPAGAGDCSVAQSACLAGPHGDGDARVHEIDAIGLELVTFYSRNLAVPARRNADNAKVLRGREVFYDTGCAACHTPSFVTHRLEGQPEQSYQQIWPYTDMLLHDMGPGLADMSPEARATGREWRTPPLWGIGLSQQVTGHSTFLHDGRARSILEAVLWHGGEAAAQRDGVIALPTADRAALLAFLESL